MGYQVTITRAAWDDDDGGIGRDEWLGFIGNDDEFTVQDAEDEFPVATWKRGAVEADFNWEDGGVWCWSPEEAVILKMIELGDGLSASAYGEGGKKFERAPDGSLLEIDPDDGEIADDGAAQEGEDPVSDKLPWWKKIFG